MARTWPASPSSSGPPASPTTRHVEMLVVLPDRPGGLGAVASRIGSVGGDITAVTIRSRAGGRAEDAFHVDLPVIAGVDIVGLLVDELSEVDGVRIVAITQRDPCGACTAPVPEGRGQG